MAAKDVKFGSDARARMMEGVDTLANAVKVTLARKAGMWFWKKPLAPHGSPKMV